MEDRIREIEAHIESLQEHLDLVMQVAQGLTELAAKHDREIGKLIDGSQALALGGLINSDHLAALEAEIKSLKAGKVH